MPRRARKSLNTTFLHVITQGIAKEEIFKDERDIRTYLYLIKKYYKTHNIRIIAYCIMNNHAHLLINAEQIEGLSQAMQKINLTYGIYYNTKNERVGYVFRDRFLSEAIQTERHLLSCIVYIHNNPVKAGIANELNKYKYSSYNDYMKGQGVATKDTIGLVFGGIRGYLEQFNEIHKIYICEDFLEDSVNVENKYKSKDVINDYLTQNNITIEEIKTDKEKLKSFLIEVRDKGKVSNRKVAEILQIGRETLRKM